MSSNKNIEEAIAAISDPLKSVYDVTIICTTDDYQAEYWMKRLSEGVCSKSKSCSKFPLVLAVSEDWGAGGAGNGLGTLYAYQKACRLALSSKDVDLELLLNNGSISAALYHTAGKGTRLAPLPASENNNKPGVKLPFSFDMSDGTSSPMTVLEAVIKQTSLYASSRKGRLSVFWGDQVFIPSAPFLYKPTHHVDIMCTLLGDTAPTSEEWAEQGLEKYGVIAVMKGPQKNAAQVEKVSHATAVKMLEKLGDIGQVGPSLGSFSVSAKILSSLCHEFSEELKAKTGKLDTDPHFWMPLTLSQSNYVSLMAQKGVNEDVSIKHHDRMSQFLTNFESGEMGLFGAVDVGKDAAWWDYGQLKKYFDNNMKLISNDDESKLLHKFLGVTSRQMNSSIGSSQVDSTSCLFSSKISQGSVSNSVLANVRAVQVEAENAIVVNCVSPKIVAPVNSILYNVISSEDIILKEKDVLVGVLNEDGTSFLLKSTLDTCGGKTWKSLVEGNPLSFEAVHLQNKNANVVEIEKKRHDLYQQAAASL